MRDATTLVHDLRGTLAATRPDLEVSVHNFRIAAESMARMTSRSETNVVDAAADLRRTVAQFDTLPRTAAIGGGQDGPGFGSGLMRDDTTFGKLVSDRELYDRLMAVAAHTDSLVGDIRENPKRYLKVSLF
jgi:hypothetical protein